MAFLKPPPEAQLIERLRKAKVPALSRARAAVRAGISEARWRQIETGRQRFRGKDYPVTNAPPKTVAMMGYVVGATPAQFRDDAGRPDVAAELETILASPPDTMGNLVQLVRESRDFTDQEKVRLIDRLRPEE